jgi:hypothetical protein
MMTLASCSTCYNFYGFPAISPLDGLFLWIRTGAISGQQCSVTFAVMTFSYCPISGIYFMGFPQFFHLTDCSLDSEKIHFWSTTECEISNKLFYYIPTFLSFGGLVGFGEEPRFWTTIAV